MFNKTCEKSTGYFLHTLNTSIKLKIKETTNNLDFAVLSYGSFSIWFKYLGVFTGGCANIINLNDDTTICFDSLSQKLNMVSNANKIFSDSNFINYTGQWVLFTITNNYQSLSYFSNMFNFYINDIQVDIIYDIPSPGIKIDYFEISSEVIGLFGEFRIYNDYLVNPFGHIQSLIYRSNTNLAIKYSLSGTTSTSCLSNSNTETDISSINHICKVDYNPPLSATQCDLDKFMNTTALMSQTDYCNQCNSICADGCVNDSDCSCSFKTSYLLRKDSNNKTFCDGLNYIDFARLNNTIIDNIPIAINQEYTLELWAFLHSYKNKTNFEAHEIIWDNHAKVELFNFNNTLNVRCFPNYGIGSNNTTNMTDTGLPFNMWFNIQCSTSLPMKMFYINEQEMGNLTDANFDTNITSSTLYINSKSVANYGFLLFREIKLWSIFNVRYLLTKCTIDSKDKLSNILVYFPITKYDTSLYDMISGISYDIYDRSDFIGYSIFSSDWNDQIDTFNNKTEICNYN
jgi:hypothetical protein